MIVPRLNEPWLIAVWPGMGNIAASAGYYLMAKLEMHLLADYAADGLFDVDHVDVKDGLIRTARRPKNRFFVWTDPEKKHDIVVFIGEVQPPIGKYSFCSNLIAFARELGVTRVFTFAAMATQMHPEHDSRIFAAAVDQASLEELKPFPVELLESGRISGLNGILLAAAAEAGLRGLCLLGEMPHIFSQFPFPKGSLAILEVFAAISGIHLDFGELTEQARLVEQQLGELLSQVEKSFGQEEQTEKSGYGVIPGEEESLSPVERQKIDHLFAQARENRARAFELKQELDRLGIFKEYEDRFLDLFKKSD